MRYWRMSKVPVRLVSDSKMCRSHRVLIMVYRTMFQYFVLRNFTGHCADFKCTILVLPVWHLLSPTLLFNNLIPVYNNRSVTTRKCVKTKIYLIFFKALHNLRPSQSTFFLLMFQFQKLQ